jgi:hypothetical protein
MWTKTSHHCFSRGFLFSFFKLYQLFLVTRAPVLLRCCWRSGGAISDGGNARVVYLKAANAETATATDICRAEGRIGRGAPQPSAGLNRTNGIEVHQEGPYTCKPFHNSLSTSADSSTCFFHTSRHRLTPPNIPSPSRRDFNRRALSHVIFNAAAFSFMEDFKIMR